MIFPGLVAHSKTPFERFRGLDCLQVAAAVESARPGHGPPVRRAGARSGHRGRRIGLMGRAGCPEALVARGTPLRARRRRFKVQKLSRIITWHWPATAQWRSTVEPAQGWLNRSASQCTDSQFGRNKRSVIHESAI